MHHMISVFNNFVGPSRNVHKISHEDA